MSILPFLLMAAAGKLPSQFLRPDSDVSSSNMGSASYASIDEEAPDNSDYVRTNNLDGGQTASYVCGLGNPPSPPVAGVATVRYRGCRNNSARAITLTVSVYEGATLRATGPAEALPLNTSFSSGGTWTEFSFNADLSAVTNLDDLRLRFDFAAATGGGPTTAGAVSWAEVELT